MLIHALEYAKKGWHVFPLVPGQKIPLTKNGFKDATTDPQKITEWWTKTPNANIGIATGKISGICVLDVDVKNGAQGMESLKKLPPLHVTLAVKTPSGGLHLYFTCPKPMPSKNNFMPGLDFKADGGYVVAPDSSLII